MYLVGREVVVVFGRWLVVVRYENKIKSITIKWRGFDVIALIISRAIVLLFGCQVLEAVFLRTSRIVDESFMGHA